MKGTVLLVDDSAMMRTVILRMLTLADLEFESVLEASDGQEALTLLRVNSVALVICDINMPVMNGLQFLDRVRQEKVAVAVPIVMLTTESGEALVQQAMLAGASGYIRKPLSVQHIESSVKPLLAA